MTLARHHRVKQHGGILGMTSPLDLEFVAERRDYSDIGLAG